MGSNYENSDSFVDENAKKNAQRESDSSPPNDNSVKIPINNNKEFLLLTAATKNDSISQLFSKEGSHSLCALKPGNMQTQADFPLKRDSWASLTRSKDSDGFFFGGGNNKNTTLKEKTINEVWTKDNFNNHRKMNKHELSLNLKGTKMSWTNKHSSKNDDLDANEEEDINETRNFNGDKDSLSPTPSTPEKESISSPSHHARRPMNAFLIFCKKHRPIVRKKFPSLENRGVTRILGEWWALLEDSDKESYTTLAKEYKDAFFSANPNFKWYKLPAPPLRTLTTRPLTIHKDTLPLLQSPNEPAQQHQQLHPQVDAQFTPGKLADESQLGMLSSLLKNDCSFSNKNHHRPELDDVKTKNELNTDTNFNNNIINSNNNNINIDSVVKSEFVYNPTVPEENRSNSNQQEEEEKVADNNSNGDLLTKGTNNDALCLPESDEVPHNGNNNVDDDDNNMTKQELVDKVVDSMFLDDDCDDSSNGKVSKTKQTRKSGRSCKGKRYEEFMVNGKLLKNKREKRPLSSTNDLYNSKYESELVNCKLTVDSDDHKTSNNQTPKLDLENTIKRLAERTNTKLDSSCGHSKRIKLEPSAAKDDNNASTAINSDGNYQNSYFNLELRIDELPFLSYDYYIQRKRDNKKRKQFKCKATGASNNKAKNKMENASKSPVGSKKRKNKNNITHLEKTASETGQQITNDLSGLATLAEIAAITEKIN